MSVNWNWKDKMGEMILDYRDDYEKPFEEHTLSIYDGNCLAVILEEYKDDDGTDLYNFYGFFNDKKHMEDGYLKNKVFDSDGLRLKTLKLNANYKDIWTIAKAFIKAMPNITIEIYYEEN